jgi:DNA-binding PucR family transcriptional regulator
LEALEGLLEAGGDVAAAAKALHVHRATLYRRLERVEEITGWDLERGDDRLHAHLGLRLLRLGATTVAVGPG